MHQEPKVSYFVGTTSFSSSSYRVMSDNQSSKDPYVISNELFKEPPNLIHSKRNNYHQRNSKYQPSPRDRYSRNEYPRNNNVAIRSNYVPCNNTKSTNHYGTFTNTNNAK